MRTLKHYATPLFFLSTLLTTLLLYHSSFDNALFFDSTSLTADFGRTIQMSSLFQMRWLSHITFRGFDPENSSLMMFHHIINVLIHALNTLLVFIFTRKLIKVDSNPFLAACVFASTLFLVAASQTYAVAYLIQRSILMATLCILTSLIFFVRVIEHQRTIDYLMAALFYYFGCISKEHVAVIAFFYPLLHYFLAKQKSDFRTHSPLIWIFFYALVALIFGMVLHHHEITPFTAYESHAQAYLDDLQNQSQGTPWMLLNFINQSTMLFRYLFLFLFPLTHWMSIDLHFAFPTRFFSFPHALSGGCVVLLAALALIFHFQKSKTSKTFALCLFGLFISFTTEFSVVRITEPFVIYRSYFWMIFVVPILTLGTERLFVKIHPAVMGSVLVLFLIWHAQGTLNRLQTFDALKPLWQDTLAKLDRTAPGSYRSLNSFGMALASEGNYTEALKYIDESIARNPHYAISYYNKAYCHQFLNQPELALSNYRKTLSLNPNYADAHINMGAILIEQQQPDEALKHLQIADSMDSNNFKTKNNLGALFDRMNKPENAIGYYKMALVLKPNDAASLNNLGLALLKIGKADEALTHLRKAHEINPTLLQAHFNLGLACQKTGDSACARTIFNEILTTHPHDTNTLLQLANVLALENQFDDAITKLNQVLSHDANNTNAHYNLGVLYARQQDFTRAEQYFLSCLKITPSDQNCIQALELLRRQSQN